jgi:hypothetical protein
MVPQASTASREIQETYVASCSAEMSFGSTGTAKYRSAFKDEAAGRTSGICHESFVLENQQVRLGV